MAGYGNENNRSVTLTDYEREQLGIACDSVRQALQTFVALLEGTGIDTAALRVAAALTEAEVERVRP